MLFDFPLIYTFLKCTLVGFPGDAGGEELTWQHRREEAQIWSLGRQEDPLEKGMAIHSSILVWRIPWSEEPGGLHGVAKSWTWPKELSIVEHNPSGRDTGLGHRRIKAGKALVPPVLYHCQKSLYLFYI